MIRLFRPRSHGFRAALGMALLAWTVLASGALAGPLRMIDAMGVNAAMQMAQSQAATVHCDDMTMAKVPHASHPAPMHPAGNGHGCCHSGGCYCASRCSGIVGVPYLGVVLQPIHDPEVSLIHSDPVPVHSAPPLRPPIA